VTIVDSRVAASAVKQPRPEKVAVVDDVRGRLATASAAILTEYRGLRVAQMAELRRALAGAGGTYKVYKNTLVRRAADERGLEALAQLLEGPTAIAFVEGDVSAVAKVLRDYARTHPALVVKGGLVGTSLLDARGAQALADLPSRETLLAQLAGLLAAPMQRMAALLAAVPQKLAYGLQALIDARTASGEVAAPAGEAAPAGDAAEAPVDAVASEASASASTAGTEAPTGDEVVAGGTAEAPVDAAASEASTADSSAPAPRAGAAEPAEAERGAGGDSAGVEGGGGASGAPPEGGEA
jgi:large subunit ribosomal protein L10